jgi:hypothetical protein
MRHTSSKTTVAVPATEEDTTNQETIGASIFGGKNGTILQITLHRDAT